ncbi:3'-5' RNA helicase YTHDC2-like isoform X6 [Leptidea sinapis]|uniref:3'-5' RNA helicase YTHDC2-like isoform X1 n=1 Tax=Leptidea sinapis TaxID=189913 RepID=UPI00214473FC|nr:3'-5' RNA helicase YTHDC2-like isoform X1 [Leptidea sinapis]XP_050669844.1 3'-5' RNA helicase YTHDC2-like isoform X3 [Leptidea sinapis]XP_050669846.1 3'-5' RNA helicase YTHDC2-like isoform X4 [Leptidea sinapis]XP_050669847.1 3'-5' RNA helicase YTHDC2-like isoform X5 [Leptidea sinapis]XP_050669848.1 3'-5' RNA helicase YTHDC2-like isoform X6 [Leptidea sinapis]
MSSKRGRRNLGNKHFPIAESVSIALKIQLDKFLTDENETELKFPSFLSAQERGFIHETVAKLGLKSKSRGKGVNRYLTIYKRVGSTIIQNDAKLILDSNMRCTISDLFNAFPITSKEKEDLSSCPEKERSPQLAQKAMGQLNNGVAQIPNTAYNPELMKFRERLPVYEQRHELISAINSNQVIIVAGATGCGKTTQLPQLVLDYCQENKLPARIYCTQPRRISAVSVAERVAYERMEKIGQAVGYQIRLESRVSPRTVLHYCTNGVLLRTLMGGDDVLTGVTHVFVDEVHERDKFSDFLLIALRDALARIHDLKLILMSATCDTQIFSRYFNGCPVITIPGRLFEVQRHYLEDILKLTKYSTKKMVQVERELKNKLKSGQSYWSQLEGQKQSDTVEENSNKEEKEIIDPALQADMDEFLDECFNDGSLDSFSQVLYMFLSEGVPVDTQHSSCGRTALHAAAARGLAPAVTQMLRIGADPSVRDKSGKTAYDYATEDGHEECAKILSTFNVDENKNTDPDDAADNFLLDVYNHSVSEELIDHNLMLALVKHIHLQMPKGSILIFLPGYDDIVTLRDLIQGSSEMTTAKYQIFTLHSNMQTSDQKKVFNPLPNARKIIISTNIAETSITIDDVVYVVDSCKVKEKYYESNGGVCSLQCVWSSRACGQQRAGRAGRTRPGHCFHMCSRRRHKTLPLNSVPEILRVPLQELCLHTKLLAPGNTPIADFLSKALEPPSFLAVRNAVTLLKTIGALTPMEDLTEIGQHLLDLTVEPKLGKMLLYACVMKCLDPILTIVCSLSNKEPFQISMNPENRKKGSLARKELSADSFSDHMALLRAFQAWQCARANFTDRAFCAKNLICGATMEMIVGYRSQLLAQLRALCLVKARGSGDIKDVNMNSEKWHVVKAVLVSGLYPSIARVDRDSGTLRTSKEVKVAFHPSSTLHRGGGVTGSQKSVQSLPTDWVVFEEISRVGRFCFIRCNTLVTPLTVALFGGPLRLPPGALTQRANPPGLSSDSDSEADDNNSSPDTAVLTLDEWMAFTADAADAISVYYLRQKLCALVIRRMANPAKPTTPLDEQILTTAVQVLGAEEKNVGLMQPSGIGQRPKPLTVDSPIWRTREDSHYQYGNDFVNSFYHGYRRNYSQFARSPISPSGRAVSEGPLDGEGSARYFIVKADEPHSVDAAQATGNFPFTQNTIKKLQKAKQEGGRVVAIFSCISASKLTGAAVIGDASGNLEWLSNQHLPFHMLRHITNSLANGARVIGARDGTEICSTSGRTLLAALTQRRRHAPSQPRPIQKHPSDQ